MIGDARLSIESQLPQMPATALLRALGAAAKPTSGSPPIAVVILEMVRPTGDPRAIPFVSVKSFVIARDYREAWLFAPQSVSPPAEKASFQPFVWSHCRSGRRYDRGDRRRYPKNRGDGSCAVQQNQDAQTQGRRLPFVSVFLRCGGIQQG